MSKSITCDVKKGTWKFIRKTRNQPQAKETLKNASNEVVLVDVEHVISFTATFGHVN